MRIEKTFRRPSLRFCFTKVLSVASNARLLRRKGVDKRSRFTAPPTVPTVLDDESAVSSSRGAFFCRDVQ